MAPWPPCVRLCCGTSLNASPSTGGTELRRCFDTVLPTTLQKHAENITIYLHCFNRLKGKDAAVLGKQVLKFYKKKGLKIYV